MDVRAEVHRQEADVGCRPRVGILHPLVERHFGIWVSWFSVAILASLFVTTLGKGTYPPVISVVVIAVPLELDLNRVFPRLGLGPAANVIARSPGSQDKCLLITRHDQSEETCGICYGEMRGSLDANACAWNRASIVTNNTSYNP
jgi:hypothetical protein